MCPRTLQALHKSGRPGARSRGKQPWHGVCTVPDRLLLAQRAYNDSPKVEVNMHNPAGPLDKRGSIPMVLGVSFVLGTVAAGSIFMAQGTARSDKRAELIGRARGIAQTAIEETLVKITNSKVSFSDKQRLAYPAVATMAMYGGKKDNLAVKVANVEVMGRLIEEPKETKGYAKFQDLASVIPGFYKGGNDAIPAHDPNWRTKITDPAFQALAMKTPVGPEGQRYHQQAKNSPDGDGGEISKAFEDLPVLPRIDGGAAHSSSELDGFKQKWDVAMQKVSDREAERIAGCAGNPAYGIAAEMAAMANGKAVVADSPAEEHLRQPAQAGGLFDLRTQLVTAQTEAEVHVGSMKVREPVRAERLVYTVNFQKIRKMMRDNLMAYVRAPALQPHDEGLRGAGLGVGQRVPARDPHDAERRVPRDHRHARGAVPGRHLLRQGQVGVLERMTGRRSTEDGRSQ